MKFISTLLKNKNLVEIIFSSLVRFGGVFLGLLVSIIISRNFGASGIGKFSFFMQLVQVLSIVGLLGFQLSLPKKVPVLLVDGEYSKLKTLLVGGALIVLINAVVLTCLAYLSLHWGKPRYLENGGVIFLVSLIPFSLITLFVAYHNGLGNFWKVNLFDQVLTPIGIIALFFILSFLEVEVSLLHIALGYLVLRGLFALIIFWKIPSKIRNTKVFEIVDFSFVKKGFPIYGVTLIAVLGGSVDILLLSILDSEKSVGLYSIALKIAMMMPILLMLTNSVFGPKLSILLNDLKTKEVESLAQKVSSILFGVGLIVLVVMFAVGKSVLSLWGAEFKDSYYYLIVLCGGQLVNLMTGPSGTILIMSEYAKSHFWISIVSLLVNLFLSLALFYLYGVIGVAVATAIGFVVDNLLKVLVVWRKLGIVCLPNFTALPI